MAQGMAEVALEEVVLVAWGLAVEEMVVVA